jgi:hypothetical protein
MQKKALPAAPAFPRSAVTNAFRSVLYVSTAAREFTTPQLVALLKRTRANNEASGITGMLLYRSGNFMQALEGPPEQVGATLERIRKDKRHHDLRVIADVMEAERQFSNWHMGFAHLDDASVTGVAGFTEFLRFGFRDSEVSQNPGFAMKMLKHFRDNVR